MVSLLDINGEFASLSLPPPPPQSPLSLFAGHLAQRCSANRMIQIPFNPQKLHSSLSTSPRPPSMQQLNPYRCIYDPVVMLYNFDEKCSNASKYSLNSCSPTLTVTVSICHVTRRASAESRDAESCSRVT